MLRFNGNIGYMGLSGILDTQGETRPVVLRFKRSGLLYDIRNLAYIEGHKMTDEQEHARHLTTDIGEEGNIDRVTRILSVVHAGIVELLYPYTKKELSEYTEDEFSLTAEVEEIADRPEEPYEYRIEMEVPLSFSQTTVQLLSKLIHEVLVYRVLADWLSITNPTAAENWMLKAMQAEEKIDEIKNNRLGGVTTRPPQPF